MHKRKSMLERELEKDIRILKNEYLAEKIILFGSLNSDKVREWSDIDLLIVKKTRKRFYERLKEVYMLLKPRVGMDILVYTPCEFENIKNKIFFSEEILKKGRLLYERK